MKLFGGDGKTYSPNIFKKTTWKDDASLSKAKSHERIFFPIKQRKGEDKVRMGSPMKTPISPKKHKGDENIFELIVELHEHIDFHFFMNWMQMCIPWLSFWMDQGEEKGASRP